jgi:hypothetical protein
MAQQVVIGLGGAWRGVARLGVARRGKDFSLLRDIRRL